MPDAEGHLLRIVELQPACLMRVDLDGQFLAVNQAGLSLLGAQGLEDVLGTSVTERITATNGGPWTEFARRVWNGAPGSLECSLTRESARRSILFHAIALPDHPDQIPSLLLTARDLSDSRTNDLMAAELKSLREDAQHLEPLAAAGRLAFALSDDIQACLASAESCIQRLVAQNTCDDTQRADLEVLRRDLSQGARLLRQVVRLAAKP